MSGRTRKQAAEEAGATPFWGWAPLVGAALFLVQLLAFGYLPARAKARQLDADEAEMVRRIDELLAQEEGLVTEARMLNDAIYRERVRRTLRDPRQETLTLARARELAEQVR